MGETPAPAPEEPLDWGDFARALCRMPGFDDGRYRQSVTGRNKEQRKIIESDYSGKLKQ